MSKKRINAADVVEILATELSLTKKLSDDFVKALTRTIEEALLIKDYVKIDGLGTFKTQWNKPRKSVDVNTGEDILIDGFYRVSFTPDASLKELANQPYEHLEAVLLDTSDKEKSEDKQLEDEAESLASLKYLDEQASEIKDLLSEINALSDDEVETAIKPKVEKPNDKVQLDFVEEKRGKQMKVDVEKDTSVKEELLDDIIGEKNKIEDIIEEKIESEDELVAEESIASPIIEDKNKEESEENLRGLEDLTDAKLTSKENAKSRRKIWPHVYGFIIIVAAILLLGLFFESGLILNVKEYFGHKIKSPQTELLSASEEKSVDNQPDSYIVEQVENVVLPEEEHVLEKKKEASTSNNILTTEIVKSGSRLAQIAFRHYGAREFWVYIYEANRDKLNKPDNLNVGVELVIPKLDPSIGDKNNPDCIEKAIQLQELYLNN